MARARMIAKALSTSAKYASLHQVNRRLAEFCQALYPLIVAHADDFGRMAGDAFTVKHLVLPTSPRGLPDFDAGLLALHQVGLIGRYQVEGRQYLQIIDFERHQSGLHKRTESHIPECPGSSGKFSVEEKRTEEKGREEKGREQDQDLRASRVLGENTENPEGEENGRKNHDRIMRDILTAVANKGMK